MDETLLQHHGYLLVAAVSLAKFAGAPLPASAVLFLIGAVARSSSLSLPWLAVSAAGGAVLADTAWFVLGRSRGKQVVHMLCKVTLGSAACTRTTEMFFARLGSRSLVVAKFVPGLSMFAAPMAGLSSISLSRFWLWDTIGSLVWAGSFLALGQVAGIGLFYRWADWTGRGGPWLFGGAAMLLAALLAMRLVRRARHGPAEFLVPPLTEEERLS